jgi:acyl dehydratase
VTSHFKSTPDDRYFEDYVPGAVHEFGSIAVDEEEVIEFGKRYVPLSYHVDKEAAKNSIYGDVIASGWHTAALMMRTYSETYLSQVANLGSPGGDELRWNKPVFPGDELSVRATVLEARRSESRPDRGIVRTFIEVLNQKREVVMSLKMVNFVRCREPQA